MKRRNYVYLGLALITGYYFLFPITLGPELVIAPSSRIERAAGGTGSFSQPGISSQDGKPDGGSDGGPDGGPSLTFETESEYLFLAPDLSAARVYAKNGGVSAAAGGALEYGGPSGRIRYRSVEGKPVFSIPGRGRTPLLQGGRIFLFGSKGLTVEEYSSLGERQWRRSFSSLVTCFDSGDSHVLVGLLSGEWFLIDRKGRIARRGRPGGSRLEAVYGAALSSRERYAAVVSGIDPQRFVLYDLIPEESHPVYHTEIPRPMRRQVKTGFLGGDRWVYWEHPGGVSLLPVSRKKNPQFVSLEGKLTSVSADSGRGLLVFHTLGEGSRRMKILNQRFIPLTEKELPLGDAAPLWSRGGLYLPAEGQVFHWNAEVVP